MNKIEIIRNPEPAQLDELGVWQWPTWGKEVSRFPWQYDETEQCYLLEGRVTVTPEDGEAITIQKGDLVTFPAGMRCEWDIHAPVFKHYRFEGTSNNL